MKKTLAVAALLAAFAGSAAADVTVYGSVDMGVRFTGKEVVKAGVRTNSDAITVESGNAAASRIGIKASEKVSDTMKVGVVLENGFTADNGADTVMFDREARLYVETQYGTLSMGRMGVLSVDGNYSGIMSGIQSNVGSGNNSLGKGTSVFVQELGARADNVITYASPVMQGAQVWAQYISGADNTSENKAKGKKYAGLGVTYKAGAFQTGMVVGKYMNEDQDNDTLTVDVGANYDFGVAKVFAGAQYFQDASDNGLKTLGADGCAYATPVADMDGFGLTASATAPVLGGFLDVQTAWAKGESDLAKVDVTGFSVGARYRYNISKSYYVYVGTQYTAEDVEEAGKEIYERNTLITTAGMRYVF